MEGLAKSIARLFVILFSMNQVVNGKLPYGYQSNYNMSCHQFTRNQPIYVKEQLDFVEAPSTCVFQNISKTPEDFECIYTANDEKCGTGFSFVPLNSTTCDGQVGGMIACCKPCDRCVIKPDSSDCNSECCQWARLSPGSQYTKRVGTRECLFSVGRWGDCDPLVLQRYRTDNVINIDFSTSCPTVHRIIKICRSDELNETPPSPKTLIDKHSEQTSQSSSVVEDYKTRIETLRDLGCRYTDADLSDCSKNNTRTLLRHKTKGPEECPEEIEDERPCYTIRCFYGKWSRWTVCENYVQIRERKVLTPDAPHCDKTHKARICNSGSFINKRRRRKYRQSPNS